MEPLCYNYCIFCCVRELPWLNQAGTPVTASDVGAASLTSGGEKEDVAADPLIGSVSVDCSGLHGDIKQVVVRAQGPVSHSSPIAGHVADGTARLLLEGPAPQKIYPARKLVIFMLILTKHLQKYEQTLTGNTQSS